MAKLRNTIADACVVLGVNSDTDLSHLTGDPHIAHESKHGPYKQNVLAVFTETIAYFPEARHNVEAEPFYEESQVICPKAVELEQGATPHTPTRRSVSYNPNAKRVLPFSDEVINSLPTFCFPSGGYVYKEKQAACVNYLVLTNMEGLRTYAVSITYSCPFFLLESSKEKGKYKIANNASADDVFGNKDRMTKVYIPICVCLVSMHPFFNTIKECLSALLPQLDEIQMSDEFWRPIMKLTTTITTTPVPPPGPLAIEVSVFGVSHKIYPADETGRRIIDIDLQLPLLIFSPEVIVKIICCFLTQQRMIFMSSTYPLLTLIIEAFFTYLDPIDWRLTYVPVLPNSLADLMEAPGPFIMGVHSDLKNHVKQIRRHPDTPSIVLIDIDRGVLDINCQSKVPEMPHVVAESLLVRLRKASSPHQIALATLPGKFSYEEQEQQRMELFESTKAEIKDIFLDMLVSLFGDVSKFMVVAERYFDVENFLQQRHDDERSFFIEVTGTDAFQRFMDERMENQERRDMFTVLGERMAAERRARTRSCTSAVVQAVKMSATLISSFKCKTQTFVMPMLLEESLTSGNFYRVYCNSLTNRINEIGNKNMRLKASFLYLRGFAHIACNHPIEGLKDFHSLYATAPELSPWNYIKQIVSHMDPETLATLQREEFYQQIHMSRSYAIRVSDRNRNLSRKYPNNPLTKTEFEKRAMTFKIAQSPELIEWLFSLLANGRNDVLPETFKILDKAFSDALKHSENREVSGVIINTKDHILKVSPLISSTIGMGRLVLTTSRLLFVKNGAREHSLVAQLMDIKQLIKYQHKSIVSFTSVQAIRIINSDRNIPPFYACLKEDRDLWYILLQEMSTAQKLAEAMKDSKIVDAAKNNVLLAKVLLDMNYPFKIVEGACLFMKRKSSHSEREGLSEETRESLEMRLDPCVREAKRTTVMSIVYIPRNLTTNESPSIWCGMGSGAIKVYDTNQWNCVSELRYAKNRISCLSLVGSNQLWAGSFDSVIYVINTDSRKSEQQLQNHTDFVSDIIVDETFEGHTTVWSSSYNGQVVCWDPETRQAVKSFVLKKVKRLSQMMIIKDMLWCVTSDRILLVDTSKPDGSIVQKLLVYDDYGMPLLIEYALQINEKEVWVGSQTKGKLVVWDSKTLKSEILKLDDKVQICSMVVMADSVWVGDKDGKIFVIDQKKREIERELHAHTDVVRSMCVTSEGHVVSGSASKEGKICVWNAMFGFDVIDQGARRGNFELIEKSQLPDPVDCF